MSPRRGLVGLLLLFLQLATLTAAWPWPPTFKDIGVPVIKRADTRSGRSDPLSLYFGWANTLFSL